MEVMCSVGCVQVTTVCQRMLKEREEQVRVEYDKVLVTKLAGEYKYITHTHMRTLTHSPHILYLHHFSLRTI